MCRSLRANSLGTGLGAPLPKPFGDNSGAAMIKTFSPRVTGLAVTAVLFLALLVWMSWFYVVQRSGSEWVRHTLQVQGQLYRLLGHLEDTETGERGYLLTGDDSYLAPYDIANEAIAGEFKSLSALTADNIR